VTLTQAFATTSVALERSMAQVEGLLEAHQAREQRHTHKRPLDPEATEGPEAVGRLTLEFLWEPSAETRRGVRISVQYQPTMTKIGRNNLKTKVKGTTPQMAARALYWFLKAKFDAIDYGIEEFDVAFMPHLVMALGETFAEQPFLIGEAMSRPDSLSQLALPAPATARVIS